MSGVIKQYYFAATQSEGICVQNKFENLYFARILGQNEYFKASMWNGQNAEYPTARYYLPTLQDDLHFRTKIRIHEN